MPLTDTTNLKRSSQDWAITFDLYAPRAFRLSDVGPLGTDAGDIHSYPPAADPLVSAPQIAGYDGVIDFGSIGGSIAQGGFSATLTIPEYPADWAAFFGVDLRLATVHGGIPGIIGASGVDPDTIRLFRGYQQAATAYNSYTYKRSEFQVESSMAHLRRAGFSRGFDFYAGGDHAAPTTAWDVISHIVYQHTNLTPRSLLGLYIPNHQFNSYSIGGGSVASILQTVADNCSAGEGWVFCDREDNLQIMCSPNLAPALHPTVNDPIIHLDEELVLHLDGGGGGVVIPEVAYTQVGSVQLTATMSDQTSYATPVYYTGNGEGDRVVRGPYQTDDWQALNALAERLLAHLNRRYRGIQVTLPLNVAVNLGDCVLLSVDGSNNNRGITWAEKKFCCVAIAYNVDMESHVFTSVLTLDEVIF